MEALIKRILDFVISFALLILTMPIILIFSLLIFLQDYSNPLYTPQRVGRNERPFTMIKLRSMIINADKSGVDSTANNDSRITVVGALVRRFKLDELMQLVNVVKGDMSLVGPRPNVKRETDLYTSKETKLLSVRPGITDLASIVFSDEGKILENQDDPDIAYNQLIRPGKGYLGLFYIDNRSFLMDMRIILLTGIAIFNMPLALAGVVKILKKLNAPEELIAISMRDKPLVAMPPPGATKIVTNREGAAE